MRMQASAVKIQAAYRRHVAVKRYLNLRNAALTVQRQRRAKLAGQVVREEYLRKRKAAITIQAIWRGSVCRYVCLGNFFYRSGAPLRLAPVRMTT